MTEKLAATSILTQAHDSTDLFHQLYQLHKKRQSKMSMSWICRECGIPSRGYLSEFLNGKRRLGEKYWEPMIAVMQLEGTAAQIARLLLKIDAAKEGSEQENLATELTLLRRVIQRQESLPENLTGMYFAIEVFCAFGLFGNQPSERDLIRYYGRDRAIEVTRALAVLKKLGLIALEGEHYKIINSHLRFDQSEGKLSHKQYIRMSIDEAQEALEHWFPVRDQAMFETVRLSVKKQDYESFLKEFRDLVVKYMMNLESSQADQVISMNLQIFPLKRD